MTRFTTFAALVAPLATAAAAAAILLAPATASAAEGGTYTCAPNAPGGEVLTCVPAAPAPAVPQATDDEEPNLGAALAPVYAPPVYAPPPPPPYGYYPVPPAAEQTLAGRTHNWLAPTGEMLRAGDAQVTLHQFIFAEAAYGVTDRFEINASAPIVPIFGSAGARFGLTPRTSNLRLVIGGSVWFPVFAEDGADDDVAVISGTVTAAYQTERLNLHGSLSLFTPVGDGSDDEQLGITSVGGTFKLGRKMALMAEYVQVIVGDTEQADRFALSAVGVKFLGRSTDVDLGYVFPHVEDDDDGDFFGMPMLSISHKF